MTDPDYAGRTFDHDTVAALVAAQVEAVREIVDGVLALPAETREAPVFDLARLDQDQLRSVRERLTPRRLR